MNDYVKEIAKIDKYDRYSSIIKILEDNNIKYRIQEMREKESLGNIVVEYNKSSEKKIVVGAHYDNVLGTPGANDNASACSILLNLILDLKDTTKHIEFVFFDLEEFGGIGSYEYLKMNDTKIEIFINLDMCGIGDKIVVSSDFIDENNYQQIFKKFDITKVKKLPPSDAVLFIESNIPTLYIVSAMICDLEWYKEYYKGHCYTFPKVISTMHTIYDTADKINYNELKVIKMFIKEIIENTK